MKDADTIAGVGDMGDLIFLALLLSKRDAMCHNKDSMAMCLKVSEEAGELATAVLKHNGYLAHKELTEGIFEESADVLNCVLAVLVASFPDMGTNEIYAKFLDVSKDKLQKYLGIIEAGEAQ